MIRAHPILQTTSRSPIFPQGTKRERAWKSPYARKGDTRRSLHADVLWGSFVTHSFLPPWGRNECVTNEPQRTSAGRLPKKEKKTTLYNRRLQNEALLDYKSLKKCSNRLFALWHHFTITTRILRGFAFLCKWGLLLFKPHWDNLI